MIRSVHQFLYAGDAEVSVRELLNEFIDHPRVPEASVHNAPGALTVILIDDPPQDLVDELEAKGWDHRVLWRRS